MILLKSLKLTIFELKEHAIKYSKELHKHVQINVTCDDYKLPEPTLLDIKTILLQLLNNACDHAIESSLERSVAQKPNDSTITIVVVKKEGGYLFEIKDDGRGIDADHVVQKAVRLGLVPANDLSSLKHQWERVLFLPGFTTLDRPTTYSGRGVGLDIVKNLVEKNGGTIQVSSQKNKGSTFSFWISVK